MERWNNANINREVILKARLWNEVPREALANTCLGNLSMLISDQSHLHRKWLPFWNLNSLSPNRLTLEMGADLVSHILFPFGVDSFGLWPESILFCEEFPNEDRVWWAILALQVAEDRCPVGSCHISHPHTLLSSVCIRQHCHTLPCTSIFN